MKTAFVARQKKFNFNSDDENSDLPRIIETLVRKELLQIIQFNKLKECIEHIHSHGIKVIGVEIDETVVDVENADTCFAHGQSVAFMMGNKGTGMNEKQMVATVLLRQSNMVVGQQV